MSYNKKNIVLRPNNNLDDEWIDKLLIKYWSDTIIVTRGKKHDASTLPSIIAEFDGQRVGVLTYCINREECEIISLISLFKRVGIGIQLLRSIEMTALDMKCKRVWLVTTNDNEAAVEFYLKNGYRIKAVHKDAIVKSRILKPTIPMYSPDGVPIKDEIEMEKIIQ